MGMSSPVLASLRCPSEVLPSPSLTPAAVSILNQVKDIRINPVFCPFVHSLDKWRSSKATGDAQQHRVGQTSSVKRRKTNWWQLAKNSSRTCLPLYPPLLALPRRPSVLERSPNCRRRWPKRRWVECNCRRGQGWWNKGSRSFPVAILPATRYLGTWLHSNPHPSISKCRQPPPPEKNVISNICDRHSKYWRTELARHKPGKRWARQWESCWNSLAVYLLEN